MSQPFHRQQVIVWLLTCLVCSAHSIAQEFSLGPVRKLVEPAVGVPNYESNPDGHISLVTGGNRLLMFWPGSTSYRTRGTSIFDMDDTRATLRPGKHGQFDAGGAWLTSVFRQSGSWMIGFYHCEDHYFPDDPNSRFVAWKSIACCTSDNDGWDWKKHGAIITSATSKPSKATWGGCGDHCVVWDAANKRWMCFYQEHFLHVAASSDPGGKPGTWKKFYEGNFNEPGLGGRQSPLRDLMDFAGGNPFVHFNTFLQKWVIVWGTWGQGSPHPNCLMISTSDDLLTWSKPKVAVAAEGRGSMLVSDDFGRHRRRRRRSGTGGTPDFRKRPNLTGSLS